MEPIQITRQTIEEMLQKMGIESEIETSEGVDGIQFVIRTSEGGLLIGEDGKNILSLHHLLRKIIEKKLEKEEKKDFSFSLDVNDYQLKKIEDLKNLARLNAQRVRYFKKEVVLKPMSSFERRVIHMFLADSPDIATESRGEEPLRQVVIKPYL